MREFTITVPVKIHVRCLEATKDVRLVKLIADAPNIVRYGDVVVEMCRIDPATVKAAMLTPATAKETATK